MVKCVSFTKTHLLIIVSEIVIDDSNAINKNMLAINNNKCCIDIIKMYNLRQKKKGKRTPNLRWRE